MYTFTRAPNFSSGSGISAADISKLADAFNDRLKSGVGDTSRRVHQAIMNSMRNPRNPLDEFTFGSQMEQLTYYNHVPSDTDDLYYDADAGTPVVAEYFVEDPDGETEIAVAIAEDIAEDSWQGGGADALPVPDRPTLG